MTRPGPQTDSAGGLKMLLVASSGGHIAQLVRLAPGLGISPDSLWVSFDTPQVRSLLEGQRVEYVPYVRPRDLRGVWRAGKVIRSILRRERFDLVVSTGAAVAISALPLARMARIRTLYIETVSRVEGPSMTGRIVHGLRLAETRTQHPHWAGGRWGVHPSVFSTFHKKSVTRAGRRLFVTLGTIEGYRFDALVDAVLATGLADDSTVWQTGYTRRDDLPGRTFEQVPAEDFDRFATEADVVISHAGVGSLLGLLELGVYPLLVPRRVARKEHVDDHQTQIAGHAARLGVAGVAEAASLDADAIHDAARFAIERA